MADIRITKVCESYALLTCEASTLRELSEKFTFEVPGAKFSPSYRARRWDGKIRMIAARGRVLLGLVPTVVAYAQSLGYTTQDDTDVSQTKAFSLSEAHEFTKTLNLPFEPRDYQLRAFALAIRSSRCVLISPTGSGKSLIAYMIARYHNRKTLIVVPTISLVAQMTSDFAKYGYEKDVHGITAGVQKTSDCDITITTWQSVFDQPAEFFSDFELIIGDEAHTFKAKSLTSLLTKMKNTALRVGMTGTLDNVHVHELVLNGLFGPIHQITTASDLMNASTLANLRIRILVLSHPQKVSISSYAEEMDILTSSVSRNKFIRNLACSLKGNTLILFQYVEKHGKILADMISEKTDKIHFLHGEVDLQAREAARHTVETNTSQIIIASYGVFSTGVDIRNLHNIIFASPSKSRVRVLQSIGRGLRISDNKAQCDLYDIADELKLSNRRNYTLNHMVERVKMYSAENFPYEIHNISLSGS